MVTLTDLNSFWLEHNNKTVIIDSMKCKLRINTIKACYPYDHTALSVYAEPINKASKLYQDTKQLLRDHWFTDILGSDILTQCNVMKQLGIV